MACRRQQSSLQDLSDRYVPNTVNQLTFKYMEMCKMDSSTDSDSEISPRWSDTSTLGCASSAPENGASRRTASLTYKSAGRHASHSLFLDPYDGSSEDSDQSNADAGVSSRQTRQQGKGGGCRLAGRRRRPVLHHPAALTISKTLKTGMRESFIEEHSAIKSDNDVQMKCGSESELWDCEFRNAAVEKATHSTTRIQTVHMELQLDDSGFHTRSSTPHTPKCQTSVEESAAQMVNSCFERSLGSCSLRSVFKRRVELQGADVEEPGPRKRHCVDSMEERKH